VTAVHVRDAFMPDVEARAQDPMRNLAAAILERAIDDYRRPMPTSRARLYKWRDANGSACEFFFGVDSNFEFFAWALGIDPDVIRKRLQRGGTRAEATRGGVAASRGAKC
jgi:hypothetical protein